MFEHISLDGLAAGPGGDMSWIHVDNEIFEIAGEMTDQSDAALYGRVTFEIMDSYWPTAADTPDASAHDRQHSAWYNKVPKYVLSRTLKSEKKDLFIFGDDAVEKVRAIKDQPGRNILMLGSPSAARPVMEANLIDEYYFFVNPVILGKGFGVFTHLQTRLDLKLAENRNFNKGVVMLRYEALR